MLAFLAPFKLYILGGLLIAVIAAGVYHVARVGYLKGQVERRDAKIAELKVDITALETSLKDCKSTNDRLAAATLAQSQAFDRLEEETKTRIAESEKAAAKAKANALLYQQQYDKLLRMPPANPNNACESFTIRLNEYIESRIKESQK